MLFVERSNRTERLLEGLAERLMAPGRDPLAPGVVVVQGPGMERWIAQSIAREHGVCANTAFLFPRTFLDRVFQAIPDEGAGAPNDAWEVRNLTWRIARCLAEGRDDIDFAPLARHLHASDGDWRLVQLANRIANLLDHYVTFRPDWVESWARSSTRPRDRDERWQARLFREVLDECGPGHVADRARAFREALSGDRRAEVEERLRESLPDAVEIFAVSTLPPLYLAVIDDLARVRDVRLSALSPSRQYWADLWREVRDQEKREEIAPTVDPTRAGTDAPPSSLFETSALSPAATLLAGLGRLGADFQRTLEEATQLREDEVDRFESPREACERPNLLARLQSRLLDLDLDLDEAEAASDVRVARDDDSIRVHLCHGPRRELEVVESLLRDAFDRDPTLRPEDVIVMAPRIDEIAPDVEAVFGAREGEAGRIPFRIADRGIFRRSPVAEAFRGVLDLLGGRAERGAVLDWIAREPVRARFGLDESGVESLSDWAGRAGIRFGIDEEHRVALGLPGERAHTWDGGLDRLALAHAVGSSDAVFGGSIAVGLDAFADRSALGAIGDILSILSDARRHAERPHSVEAWCGWLRTLLERCVARTDSNAHEHASIRSVLSDLSRAAVEADFDEAIPFEAIRERVGEAIESTPTAEAFLAGGVTFCELVPLRAIPFRVIVLLGMVDDAFPRGGPPPGFDLMARDPRPGDRSPRSDDRYLFLEALLSARDRLIVTVPAFDMRDGAARSPSVVVSDLVDTLDALFELAPEEETQSLREWLVVAHPLRASSARYFESARDPRLVNRDEEAFAAARARRQASAFGDPPQRRFLVARVDGGGESAVATDEARPTLALDDLIVRFLRSSRFFARERLRLRLPRPESATGMLDPVDLDALTRHGLGNAMLDRFTAALAPDALTLRLRADATMPSGVAGRVAIASLREEVDAITRLALERCGGERLADLDFTLELDDVPGLGPCRLVGRLDRLWPGGRIVRDFSKIGRRAECDVWIRHLVLRAMTERRPELPSRSVLVGRAESNQRPEERVVVFEQVDDPIDLLSRVFEWAWRVAEAPLPFFPRTSRAYATKARDGKWGQAWRDAYQNFEGGDSSFEDFPEAAQDLETQRVWEGWSPLDSRDGTPTPYRFDELAEAFFGPLLDAREVHRS